MIGEAPGIASLKNPHHSCELQEHFRQRREVINLSLRDNYVALWAKEYSKGEGSEEQKQKVEGGSESLTVAIACVQRMIRKGHCHEEQRRTFTAEDLIYAMAKLGFDNYAHLLTLYIHRYRQAVPNHAAAFIDIPPNPKSAFYIHAFSTAASANLYYDHHHPSYFNPPNNSFAN
ncbi:hypothetical protein VNO78_32051 [Psophocarpus tetragonolobus]|uniref:Uncharacterized protein n=1 Tax=Psophocarpus tetragonolobus TaxID=3891 RepID=A0AAN9X8A2_PSOTE